jgi:hypothetical protein
MAGDGLTVSVVYLTTTDTSLNADPVTNADPVWIAAKKTAFPKDSGLTNPDPLIPIQLTRHPLPTAVPLAGPGQCPEKPIPCFLRNRGIPAVEFKFDNNHS